MARERWRNCPGRAGYRVSSEGRVKSVPRTLTDGRRHGGQVLTPKEDADGYLLVKVAGEWVPVHVLVLEAFHGPRPPGMEGCHGPKGQKVNTAAELRWDTKPENERDKKRHSGLENVSRSRPSPVGIIGTGDLAVE